MKKKKFISEINVTKEVYKEFSDAFVFSSKKMIVLLLLALFLVLFNVIRKDYVRAIVFVVIELIYVVLFSLILKRQKRIGFERLLEAHGGKNVQTKITINEENIEEIDVGTENKMNFSFSQIQGILETDNLVILRLKYNLGIILDKNNLKGGSVLELVEHLKNVCALNNKDCNKYKSKFKYLYCGFTILLILFLIGLLYFYMKSELYFDRVLKAFESKGYTVELYSPEDADLVVYGLYKEDYDNQFYLYNFKDEDIAKSSFDDWRDEDKTGGYEDCTSDKGYYVCYIKNDGFESMIIRKNRVILYNLIEEGNKQTFDNVKDILEEVK